VPAYRGPPLGCQGTRRHFDPDGTEQNGVAAHLVGVIGGYREPMQSGIRKGIGVGAFRWPQQLLRRKQDVQKENRSFDP
jgi:hypothetical protein